MPEGPSILLFKKDLRQIVGRKVVAVGGIVNTLDPELLVGRKITGLRTFGKHLLILFGKGLTLRVHFLMFGAYRFDNVKKAPVRLHLEFDHGGYLNFYTCSLRLLDGDLSAVYDWRADIMNAAWDPSLALLKMKAEPGRMICDVLMDQEIFAGLGNIIKNETLYRTRIHPESAVGGIPLKKKKALLDEVVLYARQFLKWRAADVLEEHWEAHTKKVCVRDGHKLVNRQTGEGMRRSYFCEHCQMRYTQGG